VKFIRQNQSAEHTDGDVLIVLSLRPLSSV